MKPWHKELVTRCHLYLTINGMTGYSVSLGYYWVGPFLSKERVTITYSSGDISEETITLPPFEEIIVRSLPLHYYQRCQKYEAIAYFKGDHLSFRKIYKPQMVHMLEEVQKKLQYHSAAVSRSLKAVGKRISKEKVANR